MAELDNTNWFTLTDLYKLIGPDRRAQAVVWTLMQANPMLEDMPFIEANGISMHQGTRSKSLPGNTLVGLNEAVKPTKGLTEQFTELCSRYKAYSAFDVEILRLNGMKNAVRALQDKMHIASIGNDVCSDYLYGNATTAPREFNGFLDARMNDLTTSGYPNVINGKGTGGGSVYASVLYVEWAEDACCGIYPTGTQGGLEVEDHGKQIIGDETNGFRTCMVGEYQFRTGIYVADKTRCARLVNLPVATLELGTDITDGLVESFIRMEEMLPTDERGQRVFYAPRVIITALRLLAISKANVNLTYETYMGKRITHFNGIPVKRCDSMLTTEAEIT